MILHVKTTEPFSFTRTLRFVLSPPALLNGREFAPLLDHFVDGEYRRVAEVGGELVLYGVSEASSVPGSLRVRILSGQRDQQTRRAIARLVGRQFSTELDLSEFLRLAAADPVLSHLAEHFSGMRIPQAPSVYEALVSAIVEQQVNVSFAHQVKKALIETYGRYLELDGRRYHAFPVPAALAALTPEDLRPLQVSGPKARYIIAISSAVLDGSLDLERLRDVDAEAALARLIEHKGVGPWTAHYVGLRALGHLDCLPAADVGLQKAVQRFYGLRKQPTSARLEKLGRAWRGWRSYATFYLWLTFWESPEWRQATPAEIKRARRTRPAPQILALRRRDTK
jgi:DNA-3-methyladenine glycosylase II